MMSHKLYGPGIQGESGGRVWIGIDQSYSGFAVTVLNEASYSTVVTKFQGKGADRLSDIYAYLRDFLIDVKKEAEIVDVAIEGYAYGSQMANMLGELGGIVKLALVGQRLYPLIIPPTVLKKYVTGKGTGIQKNQMLLHVFKKWGVEFYDDNACDSYALAKLASGVGELAYEKEILEKVQDPKYREQ